MCVFDSGQKFMTHQFTFLDPPFFLDLKLISPTTSLKPAFLTHQCLPTLSRTTNVFRPSLDPRMSSDPLSNHQPPRSSRLNFAKGPSQFSEFVKDAETGNLDRERTRSSDSPGSTCLSVTKVPPDCAAHISPSSLGDHPVTASSISHVLVVRERVGRHWWVKNAGFKLVVGKINFRSKKIGGSRKVNWWVRNFCPFSSRLGVPIPSCFQKKKQKLEDHRTEGDDDHEDGSGSWRSSLGNHKPWRYVRGRKDQTKIRNVK
jgi:hypothetical protein